MVQASWSGRLYGQEVPPLSSGAILQHALDLRATCGLMDTRYFPIHRFYECLDFLIEGARFEVLFEDELGSSHGLTHPDQLLIQLREDVYDGACENNPRDRFTLAHELGHLLLHRNVTYARVDPNNPPVIYRNSEWQADKFASYLLMTPTLLQTCLTIHQAVDEFKISYEAVNARRDEIGKATS
jgi:Zn-dependent peptidase ImmA (M78 family)